MTIEYETKILDINQKEVEDRLIKLGAKKLFEHKFRRWVFDMKKEDNSNEWIRLRDEGGKVTLTYKKRNNKELDGTQEIETLVENFDIASEILLKQEWKGTYYQENRRIMYVLDDIEFCIDTWPNIPTYLEVEGKKIEDVKKGLEMLNFDGKDIGNVSVVEVYKKYNIDLHSNEILKFD